MNLSQVECFLEIVKTGSFTKAAEHLFITQQGVSRQIKAMEKYLGFPLFIRSKNGITLTVEGEMLAHEWECYFYELQTAIDKARDHYHGKEKNLKIALEDLGSVTERIVASFSEFEAKEQPLTIEFKIMPPSEIRPFLSSGEIDFAIAYEAEFRDLTQLNSLLLNDRPLELKAAMGSTHPLALAEFDMNRFLKQPFGILSTTCSTHFREIVDGVYAYYGVVPAEHFMEFQSRRELAVAVAANRCVTTMYETGFQDEKEKIRMYPLPFKEYSSRIGLFWNGNENMIKAKNLAAVIHSYLEEYN